jgi:S-adenosylmethionine/arginine decarboxylase-like enzyme
VIQPPAFVHLCAEFTGVADAQLRDAPLLCGLLIAAASAAGLTAVGSPAVRHLTRDGLSAILHLEDCHMTVQTLPHRGLFLLDVLAPPPHDPRKALDVFTRRVPAARIHSDQRARG